VCTSDEREVIFVIEMLDNVASEQETCPSRTQTPSFDFIRVGPEKITHGAFMRDFLFSINETDLINAIYQGREAAMNT
jgi:hypothetical protein